MNQNAIIVNNGPPKNTGKVHNGASVGIQSKSQTARNFAEVLKDQQRDMEVKISAHAQERLRQQNITISPQDISRIGEATRKAAMKGSKERRQKVRRQEERRI